MINEQMKIWVSFWFFSLLTFANTFAGVGSFTPITGSPFPSGASPASVAYSPIISGNLFAGIPNYNDASVTVYQVNQTNGVFSQVTSSPFMTGNLPAWLAFSPVLPGNLLFAAIVNFNDNNVSVYSVDPLTGFFTPVAGSPFSDGTNNTSAPYGVAFSPLLESGKLFAAVTNTDKDTVSVFEVNQTTGFFTPVTGSPFATGSGPYIGSFSPVVSGGLFAAVPNYNDGNVSVYSVDQNSGYFTEIANSPFNAGTNPYDISYSPIVDGNLFAAVANDTSNNISVYSVDQATGAFLSNVTGSPFSAGAGTIGTNAVTFSPLISGTLFAAAANFSSNNISVYTVNTNTGVFTPVSGSPFASGSEPDGIAFSPLLTGGLFAATANYGSNNSTVYQVTLLSLTPQVMNVDPSQGIVCGNASVTITGTNFTGATAVYFGNIPAISFSVISDSQIIAVSPVEPAGTVDISVVTPSGISTNTPADQYIYLAIGTPREPQNCKGVINKRKRSEMASLKISWDRSPSGYVSFYRVYKDDCIVGIIPANNPLVYCTCICSRCDACGYSITAVNCANQESPHARVWKVHKTRCR